MPRDKNEVEVDWAELVRRAAVVDSNPSPLSDFGRIRLDLARSILAAEGEFAKIRAAMAPRSSEEADALGHVDTRTVEGAYGRRRGPGGA